MSDPFIVLAVKPLILLLVYLMIVKPLRKTSFVKRIIAKKRSKAAKDLPHR